MAPVELTKEYVEESLRYLIRLELSSRDKAQQGTLFEEQEDDDLVKWRQTYAVVSQISSLIDESIDLHIVHVLSTPEFIASVAVSAAAVVHKSMCRKPRDPRNKALPQFCRDETQLIQNIVKLLCASAKLSFHGSLLHGVELITAAQGARTHESEDALAGLINSKLAVCSLGARAIPALDATMPIAIINAPWSALSGPEREQFQRRAEQLGRFFETRGLRVIVTSQWPPPIGASDAYRTSEVLLPMFSASLIVTYTAGGGSGTAQSIAFAEAHCIPSLIVDAVSAREVPPRNPGGWTRRMRVQSEDATSDAHSADLFLKRHRVHVIGRNTALQTAPMIRVPPKRPAAAAAAVARVDPIVFATSWIPYERVIAIISNDITWAQTDMLLLHEIANKMGLEQETLIEGSSEHPSRFGYSGNDLLHFITDYLAFAHSKDLNHDTMGRLITAYFHTLNTSPLSARDETARMYTEDWAALLRALPKDPDEFERS
jgi:hypothetical protein